MSPLTRLAVFAAVAAAATYFYDKQLLLDLYAQALANVSARATAVYTDYYTSWSQLYLEEDRRYAFYAQVFALGLIVYVVFFKRSYDPSKKGYGGRAPSPLSKAEQDALIEEWTPEPLINLAIDARPNSLGDELVLTTRLGPTVEIEGIPEPVLNLSGFDFMGMSLEDSIRDKCKESLTVYGCGSCGPRGFYGTSDQHLDLEVAIKDFFGTEEAIVYSDAACTMSSIIPAFAKRGDVVVADSLVSESAISGIELSRSTARYFKHNDVHDLTRILQELDKQLRRKGKPLSSIRRYIVVEGLYRNTGDFAPLAAIISCAKRFKYRVILDDSYAIGCVGKTGRGSLERAGLKATDVDFLAGSLATSLGSVGGFCTGSHVAVDHQRLAGSGYCFSASAPPFTCVAALEALRLISDDGADRLQRLAKNIKLANDQLKQLPELRVISDESSPMLYVQFADEQAPVDRDDRFRMEERLQTLVDKCLAGGAGLASSAASTGTRRRSSRRVRASADDNVPRVLLSRSRHVYPPAKSQRPPLPEPSIRICLTAAHSEEEIASAFSTLKRALQDPI